MSYNLVHFHIKPTRKRKFTTTQFFNRLLILHRFKIEVTKYEELEQVHAELRLKELLWKSMDEWEVLLKEWYSLDFKTIDPDDMGNTVTKYAKDVHRS